MAIIAIPMIMINTAIKAMIKHVTNVSCFMTASLNMQSEMDLNMFLDIDDYL